MFKLVFWYWWAIAAVLLVFEMMLPGVVFLFLAIGAAAAGLFLLIVSDLSIELQLLTFAVISVVAAVGLRRIEAAAVQQGHGGQRVRRAQRSQRHGVFLRAGPARRQRSGGSAGLQPAAAGEGEAVHGSVPCSPTGGRCGAW